MSTYASVDDFRSAFGGVTSRVNSWLPMPAGEQDARINRLLQDATARIDAALVDAGYVAPVVFGDGDGEVDDANLESMFRERCIHLAIGGLAASVSGMPDDMLALAKAAADWLRPGGSVGAVAFDAFGRLRPVIALTIPGLARAA